MKRSVSGFTILAVIIGIIAIGLIVHSESVRRAREAKQRQYIDSLFRDSRQTITFDSIRSVIDQRFTDSLRSIRAELDRERSTRRRETQNIRRETNKLRHRLDSIGPIDRPDL
jgi:hypothetical protein